MNSRHSRALVRSRAGNRCEYCRLGQDEAPVASFHVEHVIPRQHGGNDEPENFALACQHCNLHKGPNLSGIDPESGAIVTLFHPRRDVWDEHFYVEGPYIRGLTAMGRVTVHVLAMNSAARVELRKSL